MTKVEAYHSHLVPDPENQETALRTVDCHLPDELVKALHKQAMRGHQPTVVSLPPHQLVYESIKCQEPLWKSSMKTVCFTCSLLRKPVNGL